MNETAVLQAILLFMSPDGMVIFSNGDISWIIEIFFGISKMASVQGEVKSRLKNYWEKAEKRSERFVLPSDARISNWEESLCQQARGTLLTSAWAAWKQLFTHTLLKPSWGEQSVSSLLSQRLLSKKLRARISFDFWSVVFTRPYILGVKGKLCFVK